MSYLQHSQLQQHASAMKRETLMPDSSDSRTRVQLVRQPHGKIVYLTVTTVLAIGASLVFLFDAGLMIGWAEAVWWMSCGIALTGLGIYFWMVETRANIVAFLLGMAAGGILAFAVSVALFAATFELRGEVTKRNDVFSVDREFDLRVEILIASLSLVPGALGFLVARFANRFRPFLSGLGYGALIVGLLMASVFLYKLFV